MALMQYYRFSACYIELHISVYLNYIVWHSKKIGDAIRRCYKLQVINNIHFLRFGFHIAMVGVFFLGLQSQFVVEFCLHNNGVSF